MVEEWELWVVVAVVNSKWVVVNNKWVVVNSKWAEANNSLDKGQHKWEDSSKWVVNNNQEVEVNKVRQIHLLTFLEVFNKWANQAQVDRLKEANKVLQIHLQTFLEVFNKWDKEVQALKVDKHKVDKHKVDKHKADSHKVVNNNSNSNSFNQQILWTLTHLLMSQAVFNQWVNQVKVAALKVVNNSSNSSNSNHNNSNSKDNSNSNPPTPRTQIHSPTFQAAFSKWINQDQLSSNKQQLPKRLLKAAKHKHSLKAQPQKKKT